MVSIAECYKAPKISAKLAGGADYLSWAQEAEAGLMTNSVWKYFDNTDDASKPPDGDTELKDWKVKNKVLVVTLTLLIERLLQHLVKGSSSAMQAWKQIKDALSTQGPMYQISLMKKALVTHFNPAVDLDQTIIDLNHTMDTMFGAGMIKEDDWKTMVFINALQHEYYTPIHESLEALLTLTKDIINFQGVLVRLRYEAEKLQSAAEATVIEEVHAAFAQKKQSSMKVCMNPKCLRPSHTIEKCWRAGGGNEGGGPRGKLQKKTESSDTANAAVAEEKKEEAHVSALPTELFTMAPCSFHDSSNHFYDGHWSNMAVEADAMPSEKSLVDWNKNMITTVPTDAEIRPLLKGERINTAVIDTPHFLDSGAMSHCSPHHADFVELAPIAPHRIKGVNGSCIVAIGIGWVKLCCGKGHQLELQDVLYV